MDVLRAILEIVGTYELLADHVRVAEWIPEQRETALLRRAQDAVRGCCCCAYCSTTVCRWPRDPREPCRCWTC